MPCWHGRRSPAQQRYGPGTRRQRHPDHHEGLSLGARQADTPRPGQKTTLVGRIPRCSRTYAPPPLTSSSFSGAGATTGQAVEPYDPPKITTFGDRVNDAIQSYPLQKGIGNDPTDMQMYIRQNSN